MQILFFTPYVAWMPHLYWEITMSYALRQRGHTTRFITCSGLPECGMAPARVAHDDAVVCNNCRVFTMKSLPNLRQTAEAMQDSLTVRESEAIREWAANLNEDELQTAEYAGFPVGRYAWQDLISYWHTLEPDFARPGVVESYRNMILGAATAAVTLPRVFDVYRPDVLVTLNGSFFLHRMAVEVAKRRGVRVITHERGYQDNTVVFHADGLVNDMPRFRERWAQWGAVPLTTDELRAVEKLLQQRRQGINMNWAAFTTAPERGRKALEELGLPAKPLALLCTSSECEGSIADRAPAVSQYVFIAQAIEWFAAHPAYNLVVRVHPNDSEHAKVDPRSLDHIVALKATLPENVRLILPDEKVSTYALMDAAQAGLSYGSTAGLEMACQGKPLLHAGFGWYQDCGFTLEAENEADLPGQFETLLQTPRSQEIQRLAYRFMYYLFIGLNVPFSKVKIGKDFVNAELLYQSTAELSPGLDSDLDRVAEYILGHAELYPPPTEKERERTTETEDRFFAEQRISALLQEAQRQPERVELLVEAGDALRDIGLVTDAIAIYSAALQTAPDFPAAQEGLAVARSRVGQTVRAA